MQLDTLIFILFIFSYLKQCFIQKDNNDKIIVQMQTTYLTK